MEFGVTNIFPPPQSALELMRNAEDMGFDQFWVTDSHVIWNECYSLLGWLIAQSRAPQMRFGTMVTNPVSRDPIALASSFATLNQVATGRLVCGIGRGDSAVRVLQRRPATVAATEQAVTLIRSLASGEEAAVDGQTVKMPWAVRGDVPVYLAAYGPRMLQVAGRVADGLIIENVDPHFIRWAMEHFRRGAQEAGRDASKLAVVTSTASCIADDMAVAREQVRAFGAVVGNHVAEVMRNSGSDAIPREWSDFITNRGEYDYLQHVHREAEHSRYVPDDIIDRLCLIGSVDHVGARLRELRELGVTQVNLYAEVDNFTEVMRTYSREIMPAMRAIAGVGSSA